MARVETWATREASKHFVIGKDLEFNETRNSCPFPAICVLFLCGQHKLALRFAQEYADEDFVALYEEYLKYNGRGLPKVSINIHFKQTIGSARITDYYYQFLVFTMIGSAYKEDK